MSFLTTLSNRAWFYVFVHKLHQKFGSHQKLQITPLRFEGD